MRQGYTVAKDSAGTTDPDVILRLRAIQQEYALYSAQKLGDLCGTSVSTVRTWLMNTRHGHKPTVAHMSFYARRPA
jgi:hypothetical protein